MITAVLPLLLGCTGSGGAMKTGSGGAPASGSGGSGSGGSSSMAGMTGGSGGATGSGGGSGGNTTPPQPFEIDGRWTFLGPNPSDVPHDLTIEDGSMVYEDVDGMWSSKWKIKTYDNGLHHFQVTFESGMGTYLPVDQNMSGLSGTYDRGSAFLTIQLGKGLSEYPALRGAGSCTADDGTIYPDCRLYVKLN